MQSNTITDEELEQLGDAVHQRFVEAEKLGRNAVTLYDLGVARGLILALKNDGRVDGSQLDRMFKRILASTPPEVIATIPPEYAAHYGRGVIAPASLNTRQAR